MTTPVCSGRLIPTNPLEVKFFKENRDKLDNLYSDSSSVRNLIKYDNLQKKITNISNVSEELDKKLKEYDISFGKDTECFKSNVLSAVLSKFWRELEA